MILRVNCHSNLPHIKKSFLLAKTDTVKWVIVLISNPKYKALVSSLDKFQNNIIFWFSFLFKSVIQQLLKWNVYTILTENFIFC